MAINWKKLFKAASAARLKAHAPYSHFQVGAAILGDDGRIYSGCNVENASYGLTVCAERTAVGGMVMHRAQPVAVAIVVDSHMPTPPCGMCRQVMAEFGSPKMEVRSRTLDGQEGRYTLGELLPHAFTEKFLIENPTRR